MEVAVGELVGPFEDVFLGIPVIELVYACRIVTGEPRAVDIIDDVRWFAVDAPPALAFAYLSEAIAPFQQRMRD